MTTVLCRCRVADYDAWRRGYDHALQVTLEYALSGLGADRTIRTSSCRGDIRHAGGGAGGVDERRDAGSEEADGIDMSSVWIGYVDELGSGSLPTKLSESERQRRSEMAKRLHREGRLGTKAIAKRAAARSVEVRREGASSIAQGILMSSLHLGQRWWRRRASRLQGRHARLTDARLRWAETNGGVGTHKGSNRLRGTRRETSCLLPETARRARWRC
jgi:hypothetical protein